MIVWLAKRGGAEAVGSVVGRKRGVTVSKILRLRKLAFFTVAILAIALCVVTPSQAARGGGDHGFTGGHPGGAAGHPGFQGHPGFHGNPGFHGHPGFDGGRPFHRFGHDRFVFGFGGVLPYDGYYDYPPAYAYPTPGYWYYCPSYGTYYPYVTSCPENWVPVPAS